jgi:hypothetical protein
MAEGETMSKQFWYRARFRDLAVGQTFDFIEDSSINNSFYDQCVKISARRYRSHTGTVYTVGSINAKVYHVNESGEVKPGAEAL